MEPRKNKSSQRKIGQPARKRSIGEIRRENDEIIVKKAKQRQQELEAQTDRSVRCKPSEKEQKKQEEENWRTLSAKGSMINRRTDEWVSNLRAGREKNEKKEQENDRVGGSFLRDSPCEPNSSTSRPTPSRNKTDKI